MKKKQQKAVQTLESVVCSKQMNERRENGKDEDSVNGSLWYPAYGSLTTGKASTGER